MVTNGILTSQQQAYDSHCNLVLGDVEETVYVIDDDEDEEGPVKVSSSWDFEIEASNISPDHSETVRDVIR